MVKTVKNDAHVSKLTRKCPIDDTQLSFDYVNSVIAATKTDDHSGVNLGRLTVSNIQNNSGLFL